ncbi:MAG: hypothetical protein AAF388_26775, partial [Bacteroidota bacterium]
KILIFFLGYLCLFSTSFVYAGQQNDGGPVLSVIKKKNEHISTQFKRGDKITIWVEDDFYPVKGTINEITPDSLRLETQSIALTDISMLAKGGYKGWLKTLFSFLGVTIIIASSAILGASLAFTVSFQAEAGIIIGSAFLTLLGGIGLTKIPRRFRKEKFEFRYEDSRHTDNH